MREHMIFYIVFLSQILVISFYFPRKLLRQMRYILDTYPPSTHPKLYTKPIECYESSRRNYRYLNAFILFAGLLIIGALLSNTHDGDIHNAIAMGYFAVQMFPVMLMDLSALKELKLMRNANPSSTRKAELRPRRLLDFISSGLVRLVVITYVAFVLLIIYVDQFGFEWFGGYLNILGITLMDVLFAALVYWHMFGKKLNPHEANEDRTRRISMIAKALALASIAATIFVAITVALSAFEARYLLPEFQSLYFQLLAVIGLQSYQFGKGNFDVYKDGPLGT